MVRRIKKVFRGEELFKHLIDDYHELDEQFKQVTDAREKLRKKLINMIRYGHRGHGVHFGNRHALLSGRVTQRRFNQEKARKLMGELLYNRSFKKSRYTQLSALSYDEGLSESGKQMKKAA